MVTLFLNWIYVISEITEHYCCQIVPYLLHIKNLARINSQLVAGLWSLFFPTYISAWVVALLKLPSTFLVSFPGWCCSESFIHSEEENIIIFLLIPYSCLLPYILQSIAISFKHFTSFPVCMALDQLSFSEVYFHTKLRLSM